MCTRILCDLGVKYTYYVELYATFCDLKYKHYIHLINILLLLKELVLLILLFNIRLGPYLYKKKQKKNSEDI